MEEIIVENNLNDLFVELSKIIVEGNLYLVGGFLYRNFVSKMHSIQINQTSDLDFVVDKIDESKIPVDWHKTKNKYGVVKIILPQNTLDIDFFVRHSNINHLKLDSCIESYLKAVPLTIQSNAFDVEKRKILGDKGIESLNKKIISVNN